MKLNFVQQILLSILSGLILSLGWMQLEIGWIILIGFIPLLFVMENLLNHYKNKGKARFWSFSLLTVVIWNIINTWWIYHATIPGAIAAVVISSLFMSLVFFLFYISVINFGRRLGYLAFVTFWISFEFLFMNSQLSWPWLILGNAFANNVNLIQWYEFTGHLGGSVWVLVLNLFIFEIIRFFILGIPKRTILKYSIITFVLLFLPITYSIVRYSTYSETLNPVDVVIIQPNIDSYHEKFSTPVMDQVVILGQLAESKADNNVDYFVAPETAIPNGMWEEDLNEDRGIIYLRSFLTNYPSAKFITGADTRNLYLYGDGKTKTARRYGSTKHFYDVYNTALQFDTSLNIQIYHKSKLVPGVEMLPYPNVLGFLSDFMLDFGGMTGSHGTQDERSLMINEDKGIGVGVPICYESVYGGFVAEWVLNGAGLLFVITNDGWWKDTPGYRQHHSFSRLRAVETRRSIARSANTGISSFINQRGDIIESLPWDTRGAIRQKINANYKITFYVKYGDYLARMSLVFSVIILVILSLNLIICRLKRKVDNS